jgi:predicted protein tyrosine phosphatase
LITKVIFVPRHSVETIGPWADWALISIGEPDAFDGKPKLKKGWHAVLELDFHDVVPEQGFEGVYEHMTWAQGKQIIDFVHTFAPTADGIIVHCRAGVSRSAAVAKWICGEYRIPFDQDYGKWNRHVYEVLITVGKELKKSQR